MEELKKIFKIIGIVVGGTAAVILISIALFLLIYLTSDKYDYPKGVHGPSQLSDSRKLIDDLKKTEKDIRYVSFNKSSFIFVFDYGSDYADIKRCADKIKLLVLSEPYRVFSDSNFFVGALDVPHSITTDTALQTGRDGVMFSKLKWGENPEIIDDLSGITEIEFHEMTDYSIAGKFAEDVDLSGITYIKCKSKYMSQLPAERLVNLKTIEIKFDYGATVDDIKKARKETKELFPDCEIVI